MDHAKRPEVIIAGGLVVFFFLPWAQLFGFGVSGYNLGQLGSYGNLAWLILVGGIATIAAIVLEADEALARMVAGVTGFLPWAGLLYGLSKVGTDLFQILSIGAYLTLLAGLALFWVALLVSTAVVPRSESRLLSGNLLAVILIALALAAPFVLYPVFLMKALCFALFACAFNLLIGYVGLLSFGHAAFFGIAGYVTAHSAKVWGLPPEIAILMGTAASALLGLVFGGLAIRRQGIYFAMVTLALAQMVFFYALQAPFTHGEDGIQAVPRGVLLGFIDLNQPLAMYYFVLAVFLIGFFVIYRTINSPFGQVLKAIRENEPRAISLGYKTDQYKLVAFVLSAALAGLAGGTKSLVFQLASLTDVDWTMSGEVVLITLLGGLGTVFGPVVGAFVVITMENYLAQFGSWVTIIQGGIFVLCVLTFRRGIVGEIQHLLRKRNGAGS
jgi:branched-chain amino acid transport system permease protein